MGLIGKVGSRLRRDAGISLERTDLYKRDAGAPLPADVRTRVEVQIGRVAADQMESLCTMGPDDRDDWWPRLERGDVCYGAWIGDALVHYSWVQTTGVHTITTAGLDVPVRPGELWIYNCLTAEGSRGLKIYPHMLQHIVREQCGAGVTAAWIYVADHNVASRRAIEQAGFRRVQTLRALRVGRRYKALASDASELA